MSKRLIFGACLVVSSILPLYADDDYVTEFSTCNGETLGSTQEASLFADWTPTPYQCSIGQYFNTTNIACETCVSGNYCPGGTYTVESVTNGLNSCPNGYGSDSGAGAQSACYRSCTTNDVAHSTAVSGKYYYGDNNQCVATSCTTGYHIQLAVDTSVDGTISYVRGKASSGVNICGTSNNAVNNKGYTVYDQATCNTSNFSNLSGFEWKTVFSYGTVKGDSRCSTDVGGEYMEIGNPTSTRGKYCWCSLTSYTPSGGTERTVEQKWRYNYAEVATSHDAIENCEWNCPLVCAALVRNDENLRETLFDSDLDMGGTCAVNTINLEFNPLNGNSNTSNTCTYGGNVTLPETNPVKTGYSFLGWAVRDEWAHLPSCSGTIDASSSGTDGGSVNRSGVAHNATKYGLTNVNTWGVTFNHGVVKGRATCQPTLDAGIAYILNNQESLVNGTKDPGAFLSEYTAVAGADKGSIMQQALAAYANGDESTMYNMVYTDLLTIPAGTPSYTTTSTGQHCFCQAVTYTPTGTSACSISSPSWLYASSYNSTTECAQSCAQSCATYVEDNEYGRPAMLNSSNNL